MSARESPASPTSEALAQVEKGHLDRRVLGLSRPTWPFVLALAVAMAILPFCFNNTYYITVLIFIGINTITAVGLNLLMGYAGQVSLGHAAFVGLGAYTSAILSTKLGLPLWATIPAAVALTSLIAYLVGMPTLRLQGHYLAMATLGFGIIAYIVFKQWDLVTSGTSGIVDVPPLSPFGRTYAETPRLFDLQTYYIVWAAACLLLVLSANIVDSRVGRAFRAVHGSEVAASTLGVNVSGFKIQVFVLSAAYAALAGCLYAHYVKFVNPEPFRFTFSIELVVMVVIGGMASVWGAVVGAGTITILSELLRSVGDYDVIAFGVILMVIMTFMPQGLTRAASDLLQAILRGRRNR